MQVRYLWGHLLTQNLVSLPVGWTASVWSHLIAQPFSSSPVQRGADSRILSLPMVLIYPTAASIFYPFFTLSSQFLSDGFGLFYSLLLEHKHDSAIPILRRLTFNYTLVFQFQLLSNTLLAYYFCPSLGISLNLFKPRRMTSSYSALRNTTLFPLPCPILPSYMTMLILLKCRLFSILLLSCCRVGLWRYPG